MTMGGMPERFVAVERFNRYSLFSEISNQFIDRESDAAHQPIHRITDPSLGELFLKDVPSIVRPAV